MKTDNSFNSNDFADRLRKISNVNYGGKMNLLAEALGIGYTHLMTYVNGQKGRGSQGPSAAILQKFANLGIDVNWLLTGDGDMMQPIDVDDSLLDFVDEFQDDIVELANRLNKIARIKKKTISAVAAGTRNDKYKDTDE